jgi:hypothetical protein
LGCNGAFKIILPEMGNAIKESRWWILGGFLLLFACEKLERNNPLDPKNPRSERPRVIFVEAFINEATPFSAFALQALDSLATGFSQQQVVMVEHHLPSTKFTDAYALAESADRYKLLTTANPVVPDIFFNGSPRRVQGASSIHSVFMRCHSAVQAEIGNSAHFTIEAKKQISATQAEIDVTVARLGNSGFPAFAVTAILWEDLGAAGRHHLVRKILPSEHFSGIAAGERKSAHFSASFSNAVNSSRLQVAVIVEETNGGEREVLQATLAE